MLKSQARGSIRRLNAEAFNLTPSALLTLFEIDATDLAFNSGAISETDSAIFRFHNNLKLTTTSIIWQGAEYIAAPIDGDGFETSSKGTLPTPKLSITSNEDGVPFLALLKEEIRLLDDLIGAKVSRIRTFAKYIDSNNFLGDVPPIGFFPDPNVEFPRDIYYIDRKASENKYNITYELNSILDVEGIKIPARTVQTDICSHHYRGGGCLYEYKYNRVDAVHGKVTESTLLDDAPPVANNKNEKIIDILKIASISVKGKWQVGATYNKGEAVFLEKNGIKYYFVCKVTTSSNRPPHTDWVADDCSLSVTGCKMRYAQQTIGFTNAKGLIKGVLPYGGYPGTNKAQG